jgi:hypothetical protein
MNETILEMLDTYSCEDTQDHHNAFREVIQNLSLLALSRTEFVEDFALYGDSSLRLLFNLKRFVKNLDFSLVKTGLSFNWNDFQDALTNEFSKYNLAVSFTPGAKSAQSSNKSNFHKEGTVRQLMQVTLSEEEQKSYHAKKKISLIIEIDTDPPPAFETEVCKNPHPPPFSLKTFTQPSVFVGKVHTLLCRSKKLRVRGEDWYDFAWLVSQNTLLNLSHLEARMRQSGHLKASQRLKAERVKKILLKRVENLDFNKSKKDILTFTKDQAAIDEWSPDFLFTFVNNIQFIN